MKIVFDSDIDNTDYLEIILSNKDYNEIGLYGFTKEFPGIFNNKVLNIYVRVEEEKICRC